jgi:alpha-ketoglutarate-dependent taurine dioxygenase
VNTAYREGDLLVTAGGRELRFPAVWLRDNCPCEQCRDPGSGQKYRDITDMPPDVAVETVREDGDAVLVMFAPDRHRSVFSRRWLAAHALDDYGDGDGRTEDDKELWLPPDLAGRRPEVSWPRLLHCLRTAADGGDTGLVDGFAAAAELRATDREAFDVLTATAVPFGYIDKATELRTSQPLIQLSPRGRVRGVRFNNRSAQPVRLPYRDIAPFYSAYRRWAALLARPERQLNLRLRPGDCLVFDNTRILHARTAFAMSADSSGRHLQGCYADLGGLASTRAVRERGEAC